MDTTEPSAATNVSVNDTSSSGTSSGSDSIDVTVHSSGADDSNATVVGDSDKSVSSNAGDSCTWYDDGECSRPRTCSDCLNVLLSNDACAVDPSGACVSMSQYESYLANRYYYTPLQRYFPSSEYTYCSANDSVCSTCVQQWNANFENTGSAGMSSYCTGTDGCVCIADCEVPDWQDTVINDQCSASDSGDGADSGSSMATRITVSIFVGVAVAVLLAFATWGVRRFVSRWHYEPDVIRRETRTRPRPPPTGPQLTLTGWKSLRQNLIDTENGFVNGNDVVALQRNTGTNAGTSNSSFAPATVESGPEIRLEQGEGFRPASPGELERRAHETAQRERTPL